MAGFLFKSPSYQLVDANSEVYAGGKLNFYLTGTETRSNVYQDDGLATPHTNPVVADSKGLFAPIYLDPTKVYKVVFTDSSDSVIQTIDPVEIDLGTGNTPFKDLTPAPNKLPYYTGTATAALTDFTAYGRSLVGVVSEAAFKSLVNLEIGTDVQAYHALLADIAGLSLSQGDVLYYDGTNLTNLGIGSADEVLTSNGAGANPSWDTPRTGLRQRGSVVRLASDTSVASLTAVLTDTFTATQSDSVLEIEGEISWRGGDTGGDDIDGLEIYLYDDGSDSGEEKFTGPIYRNSGDDFTHSKKFFFQYSPGDTASHTYTIRCDAIPSGTTTALKTSWAVIKEYSP